jgi:hypothetical protein
MRSTAMGALPFTISADVVTKLQEMGTSGDFNFIELRLISEDVHFVATRTIALEDIAQTYHETEPR